VLVENTCRAGGLAAQHGLALLLETERGTVLFDTGATAAVLAANAAAYEGVQGFRLRDHFPAWHPCWGVWINQACVIKHRIRGGIHATRNNTLAAGITTVTGHLHSLKVTPLSDYNGTRWGVDTGTLADPYGEQFADYTELSPTDWRSGFAVLTFRGGRLMWPELAHVVEEGVVEFRGAIIEV